LLRFEDIDSTRVRDEYYAATEEDMRWLGITWDGEPWRQLERMEAYEKALQDLWEQDLLYRCFCTRRDLAEVAPQEGDGQTKYPGTCRHLSVGEVSGKLAQEIPFSWRMDMARAEKKVGYLTFHDRERGELLVNAKKTGDPVLARKDIATSYHLAVVVDDAAQEIDEVTRGRDLLDATHVHRVLQELLHLPEPRYWHHALIVNGQGRRLAKRENSLAIKTLREAGVSAEDVLARACSQVER
jgi:glutamyl-Q tRNA(Asp) synthetase